MEAKDRMKSILEHYGLNVPAFAEKTGIKTGQRVYDIMSGKTKSISIGMVDKITSCFPNINKAWLLTGDGSMLLDDTSALATHDDVIMIPVINLDARGGFDANYYVDTPESIVDRMPFSRTIAKDGDCVIPVYGDSMSPKYPSGSFILIRYVELWREYIEYGAAYVLELVDERRLIKNIRKSAIQGHFLLESVNPLYESSDIAIDMIHKVFRVLMCVRRESL